MSRDVTPFKAPERYPEPPKDMYYEVPETPTQQKPAQIFPWERNSSKPTRVFAEDLVQTPPQVEAPQAVFHERKPTNSSDEEVTSPVAATPSSDEDVPADPWQNFSNNTRNAWDDIPEIEQYISTLRARRGNLQVLHNLGVSGTEALNHSGGKSWRLTDFPTEFERPSLPVTPAPIRRPSFWGEERDEAGELPAAEGVPSQEEWVCLLSWVAITKLFILILEQDPVKQLEALTKRQSLVLEKGLDADKAKELPQRAMPFGSEGLLVQVSPGGSVESVTPAIVEVSPQGTIKDVKEKRTIAETTESAENVEEKPAVQTIEKPAFSGPGAAWEKDEEVYAPHAPLGPSEDEQDALS